MVIVQLLKTRCYSEVSPKHICCFFFEISGRCREKDVTIGKKG